MGNGSTGCDSCEGGRFASAGASTACTECGAGTYSLPQAASCSPCQLGKFSQRGASICIGCGPGTLGDGQGACADCGAGTYSTGTEVTACLDCLSGSFSDEVGQTTCTLCPAGTTSPPNATSCSNCSAGTFSLEGMSVCARCPAGTFSTGVAVNSQAGCEACAPGRFSQSTGGTSCLICAAGAYSDGGASQCSQCRANSDSPAGSTREACVCRAGFADGLECEACLPGQFNSKAGASACRLCASGEYSPTGMAVECSLCDAGSFSPVVGRSHCETCPAGTSAPFRGSTQCTPCSPGLFGSTTGLSQCQACSSGRFSAFTGQTLCNLCRNGTYMPDPRASACLSCGPGTYEPRTGQTVCTACAPGTFSNQTGSSQACEPCPQGYYATSAGLTHGEACLRCAVGRSSDAGATTCGDCRPGEFPNVLNGGCTVCPANSEPGNYTGPDQCRCGPGLRLGYNSRALGGVATYNGLTRIHTFASSNEQFQLLQDTIIQASCGGQTLAKPILLPAGIYPGSTSCPFEVVISYQVDAQFNPQLTDSYVQCVPCPAGTFSTGMTGPQCQSCLSRTFQPDEGAVSCLSCPTGDPSKLGMFICEACPGRQVLQDGECKLCPDGEFNPTFVPERICMRCPINMWRSGPDMLECELCPVNSRGPGATGLSGCICNGGMEMRGTTCQACPRGSYSSPAEGGVCKPCPNGTFSSTVGTSACTRCPSSGVAWNGATLCRNCIVGKIPSQDGGSCVPCPSGYYCGLGVVIQCPLGSYSLETGLTSKTQCPACPANFFCRSPTTIQPCPANTWSPRGSITRHFCRCNNGFQCTYFMADTKTISISPEQQEAAWISAIAQAIGVHPGKVTILGVSTSQE